MLIRNRKPTDDQRIYTLVKNAFAAMEQLILAPLAVTPDRQGRGIGGALIRAAHTAAEQAGYSLIVLVGHPTYYPRFGYRPASEFGLTCAP